MGIDLDSLDLAHGMEKINRHIWHYRAGFVAVNAVVLALLFQLPDSFLWLPGSKAYDWNQVVTMLLMVLASLASFLVVQGTDPGYLTADLVGSLAEESAAGLMAARDTSNEEGTRGVELVQPSAVRLEVEEEGEGEEESKEEPQAQDDDLYEGRPHALAYCELCELTPPIRSYHCKYCEQCVSTYDHHCYIIGTCIGEKNHCKFWWYLVFQMNALWWACHVCTSSFHAGNGSLGSWIETNAAALVGLVVLGCLFLFVVPLWGFHTFLAMANMTGYECGKGPESLAYLAGTREFDLPFSNGLLNNLQAFCCIRDGFWHFLGKPWRPTIWKPPQRWDRNSEDVFENVWENRYWSCC